MTVSFSISPAVVHELFKTLIQCRGNFEFKRNKNYFVLYDVMRIWFNDDEKSERLWGFTFKIMDNNTDATIFVHRDNLMAFELREL